MVFGSQALDEPFQHPMVEGFGIGMGIDDQNLHGELPPFAILNPKFEARNPKQIQMIKIQNQKVLVLIIGILDFRACFGFRASNFGFIAPLVQMKERIRRSISVWLFAC